MSATVNLAQFNTEMHLPCALNEATFDKRLMGSGIITNKIQGSDSWFIRQQSLQYSFSKRIRKVKLLGLVFVFYFYFLKMLGNLSFGYFSFNK